MTITIGGMTFLEMDHGMNVSDTMICVEHCLQAFSSETQIPTIFTFLVLAVLCLLTTRWQKSVDRIDYFFQRWREWIAIYLRHRNLSSIVLLS